MKTSLRYQKWQYNTAIVAQIHIGHRTPTIMCTIIGLCCARIVEIQFNSIQHPQYEYFKTAKIVQLQFNPAWIWYLQFQLRAIHLNWANLIITKIYRTLKHRTRCARLLCSYVSILATSTFHCRYRQKQLLLVSFDPSENLLLRT